MEKFLDKARITIMTVAITTAVIGFLNTVITDGAQNKVWFITGYILLSTLPLLLLLLIAYITMGLTSVVKEFRGK